MQKPEQLLGIYLSELRSASRIVVGYSGGLDSTVLLKAAVNAVGAERVLAVHVNHQLNDMADQWQAHCESVATELKCHFHSERIVIDHNKGIEEQARSKRYEVFQRLLGDKEFLLLGHHANDQVETLLFRLFRGSGIKGLSGIPERRIVGRGILLRPLLRCSKDQLLAVATSQKLPWIEDDSNQDTQFDRNFIRHDILSTIHKRWPKADVQIAQAADVLGKADSLLSEIADSDLDTCDLRSESLGRSIAIDCLEQLSDLRLDNVLRRFIYSVSDSVPNDQQLTSLKREIIAARDDAQPALRLGVVILRRFQGRLYITPELPSTEELRSKTLDWPPDQDCISIAGLWEISKIETGDAIANTGFNIQFRSGGERLKPNGREHSQSLKKLLLEYQIEPWLRDLLPIIYLGNEIIAVGDQIHCANIQFQLRWLIEPPRGFR